MQTALEFKIEKLKDVYAQLIEDLKKFSPKRKINKIFIQTKKRYSHETVPLLYIIQINFYSRKSRTILYSKPPAKPVECSRRSILLNTIPITV